MPLIYEGHCSACDSSELTSDGYTAVYVDEPAKKFAHPNDPHLVILAHPCESLILEEIGYTYQEAAFGGRLVAVKMVFCRTCGQKFEIRGLTAGLAALGAGGCLGVFAGAAAAGIGISLLRSGWLGKVGGYAAFVLLVTAVDSGVFRVVRWVHAYRAAYVATTKTCPHCGGQKYSRGRPLRSPLRCVVCGQRAVRFRVVGKS
jgi:transcription elongation factor Elf1